MLQRLIPLQRPALVPAGGASAFSGAVGSGDVSPFAPDFLVVVEPPAMNTTQLPNGETLTYALIESNDPAFGSAISTTTLGTQTGAGGTGAAKALYASRLKYAGGSYFGLKITASASAAASGVSVTMALAML